MKRRFEATIPEVIEHNKLMAKKTLIEILDMVNEKDTIDDILLMRIRDQMLREIDEDKLFNEALPLRVDYLLNNPEENLNLDYSNPTQCPYCKSKVNSFDDICDTCGYSLEDLEISELDIEDLSFEELKNLTKYFEKIENDIDFEEEEILDFKTLLEKTGKNTDEINDIINRIKSRNTEKYFARLKSSIKYSFDEIPEEYLHKALIDFTLIISLIEIQTHLFENFKVYDIIVDSKELREELDKRGYVNFKKFTNKEYAKELKLNYTQEELTNILEENNLSVSGKRNKLIKRIVQNIPPEDLSLTYPKLTKKGEKFLDEELTETYNAYLNDFIYDEFKQYCEKSEKEDLDSIALEFLEEFLEIAEKRKEYITITRIHESKALINSVKENYSLAMEEFVKAFTMKLNFLGVEKQYQEPNSLINETTRKIFLRVLMIEGLDILLNVFDNAFESIDSDLTVSREDTLDALKDLYGDEQIGKISRKIFEKYYSE